MYFEEEYIAIFKMADKKNHGSITCKQLTDQMKRFGYKDVDENFKSYFGKASKNKKITLKEYLDSMAMAPDELHRAAYLRRVFKKYDTDGNNKLDKKELQKATIFWGEQLNHEEVDVLMMMLDRDMNNYIDLEEFIWAVNNIDTIKKNK